MIPPEQKVLDGQGAQHRGANVCKLV